MLSQGKNKTKQNKTEQNDLSLFPRQALNLTVNQVYASTIDAEEANVE